MRCRSGRFKRYETIWNVTYPVFDAEGLLVAVPATSHKVAGIALYLVFER